MFYTARIIGIGSYVPEKVLTNKDLEKLVETNDEWIVERTGIEERRISKEGVETADMMATEAAKRAIEDCGINPEEIDLLLVASTTTNLICPTISCVVQAKIGAKNAFCYDLNNACPGFLSAFSTAEAYFEAGMAKKALIVGTEVTSNYVDWTDRGTCILFGDGAGACVLEAKEVSTKEEVNTVIMHSDGLRADCLTCDQGRQLGRMDDPEFIENTTFNMDGKAVFKFAVTETPKVIKEALEKANLNKEDIDLYILHQANSRILESIANRVGVDMSKFPMNLNKYGNTSSASMPILMDEMKKQGMFKTTQKVVLSSFGAGVVWGAAITDIDINR